MTRRLDMTLTRRLKRPTAGPSEGHRQALERDLLARYGELHPKSSKERPMFMTMLTRSAVLAGLVLAAAAASQAPADVKAEIGKRIEITGEAPVTRDQEQAIVKALQTGGREYQVQVRVQGSGEKQVTTTIEIFGPTVGLPDVEATVRKAAPALAGRTIKVTAVERTVPGTVGDLAGKWAGLEKQLPPDELKKAIEADLRERHPGATVDVKVSDHDGKREVEVIEVRGKQEAKEAPPAKP
jgi:hypothetical protein